MRIPRRSTRVAIVAVTAALAVAAARIAAPSHAAHSRFSAALACGVDRWGIKTLKDRPRLMRARSTTIAHLISLRRPRRYPPPARLPIEHQIFTVVAAVTLVQPETDLDNHVYLASGPSAMITETPSPICMAGANPYRRRQMANSRRVARVCPRARVTGVAFFDHINGQTWGAAPNAIELHPVLDFACLPAEAPAARPNARSLRPRTRTSP